MAPVCKAAAHQLIRLVRLAAILRDQATHHHQRQHIADLLQAIAAARPLIAQREQFLKVMEHVCRAALVQATQLAAHIRQAQQAATRLGLAIAHHRQQHQLRFARAAHTCKLTVAACSQAHRLHLMEVVAEAQVTHQEPAIRQAIICLSANRLI